MENSQRPKKHHLRWTAKDIRALKNYVKQFPHEKDEVIAEVLCEELQRTKISVIVMLSRLRTEGKPRKPRKKRGGPIPTDDIVEPVVTQEVVEKVVEPVVTESVPESIKTGTILIGSYKIHIDGDKITISG